MGELRQDIADPASLSILRSRTKEADASFSSASSDGWTWLEILFALQMGVVSCLFLEQWFNLSRSDAPI
jgi:hypothetical protein